MRLSARSIDSQVSKSVDAKRVVEIYPLKNDTTQGKHPCSGVLLAGDIVATASHCFLDFFLQRGQRYYVKLGDQESLAARLYYQNYAQPCRDTGILILEKNLTTPSVPLYVRCGAEWRAGNCTGYGYGLTEHNTSSTEVREVPYKVENSTQDELKHDTCSVASYLTKAKPCFGDSGGPTICNVDGKSVFVGVLSRGLPPANRKKEMEKTKDPLAQCKICVAAGLANTNALMLLLKEIPKDDREYIFSRIKHLNCNVE
ncbi:unnamed protein product [Bursaphelenchus xylophilus]|uniref:(pine wood nematode) hypothetical protein n=1 Tax=Bursaphelenchus xylophilus TaxID=6326 RepID=A0A1I7S5L7_BURXY|nr:unnamed protein product [Bursaphelenchus xylophilus]CAG9124849.1 unnamed protein product [Bursaphelenchus xylophilus]